MSQLYRVDRFGYPAPTARIQDVQEGTSARLGGAFVVKVPDSVPIEQPLSAGDLITKKALGYLIAYSTFTRIMFDDMLDGSAVDIANSAGCLTGGRGSTTLLFQGYMQSLAVNLGLAVLGGTFSVTNGSLTVPTTNDQTAVLSPLDLIVFATQPSVEYTIQSLTSSLITLTGVYSGVQDAKTLGYSVPASAPTQALITWDTFTYNNQDPSSGLLTSTYQEEVSNDYVACMVSFNGGANFYACQDNVVFDVPLAGRGTSFIIQLTNTTGARLSIGSWSVLY